MFRGEREVLTFYSIVLSPLLGIPSLFRILRRVGFSPDLNLLNILLIVIYFSKWVE